MIYDCQCLLFLWLYSLRRRSHDKKKPLTFRVKNWNLPSIFVVFLLRQCVPHRALYVECHPPHNVCLYYAVDVFIHIPPMVSCDSWCISARKNRRTPSVTQLSAFPNIQPGPAVSVFHLVVFSFLYMDDNIPARRAHTIWLDVTKQERWKNHQNKERTRHDGGVASSRTSATSLPLYV